MDKRNSAVKQAFELDHWVRVFTSDGARPFDARHPAAPGTFEKYCQILGLSRSSFVAQVVVDLGCGAYGSRHFFDARLKFGVDILSRSYVPLGILAQDMIYLSAPVEDMPFVDGFADAVLAPNSLDHVDDFPAAVRELSRILKVGGRAFLAFNLNNPKTIEEPSPADQQTVLREVQRWLQIVRQEYCEPSDLPTGMDVTAARGLLVIEARRTLADLSPEVRETQALIAEANAGVPTELRLLRLAHKFRAPRSLLGRLHAAAAFVELNREHSAQAAWHVLQAFVYTPASVSNRGLWSILVRKARPGQLKA